MKLLVVNRKKILLAMVAIMVTGLFASMVFSPAIATFQEKREEKGMFKQLLREYNGLNGGFKFKLPAAWNVWENDAILDNELFIDNFKSPDQKISGSVEMLKTGKTIVQMAETLKKWANENPAVKTFEINEIMVNQKIGYLVTYTLENGSNISMKTYIAIIENGENTVIFSMTMEQKNHKKYYDTLFNNIIQSLKTE